MPRRRRAGQRGAATAEVVIATPLLLLMIMTVVQLALWQHAGHVAGRVADAAQDTARVQGGTAAAGKAYGENLLAQLAGGALPGGRVHVTRTAGRVSATVAGTAPQLIPFLRLPVRATATGPAEEFQPDPGEPTDD